MKRTLLYLFILLFVVDATAQIRLPRLISDGVVLQRDIDLNIWGWSGPGEKVRLEFNSNIYQAEADADGLWKIMLPSQKAGGPFELKFTGSNSVTVSNVLFGDVWLCSGQSNMELPMERVKEKYPEAIRTSAYPQIRQFQVPDEFDFIKRNTDISQGKWIEANPSNVLSFSAVAYFFAVDIHRHTKVPVGLINAALGGSPAEAWMSEEALQAFPDLLAEAQRFKNADLIREIETKDRQNSAAWYAEMNASDPGLKGIRWSAENMDDSDWKTTTLPGDWPSAENGSMWFRKEINITKPVEGEQAMLWLGRIVDADSVFLNGKFVGSTGYQYPPRRYSFPSSLIKTGANVIAVRVISNSGVPGFVKDKEYYLATGNDTLNLAGEWKYKRGSTMRPTPSQTFVRWKPMGLFNKMIAPLIPFKIKGVIWYQGESNAGRSAKEYERLFPALIRDWRNQWKYDFPFLFVQLPNFMKADSAPVESGWAELRNAQLKALSVAGTGMVVAIDAGEWNDIHPLNKRVIGERLALLARRNVYGEKKLVASGPLATRATAKGNTIEVEFNHIGSGLVARNAAQVKEVAISSDGKTFAWAEAKIKGNKLVITRAGSEPVKVIRYAWSNNPDKANLYNKEGLPASPFQISVQ